MMWDANSQGAMFYGECIYSLNGETDYNYGYSNDPNSEPRKLLPPGAELLSWKAVEISTGWTKEYDAINGEYLDYYRDGTAK